MKITGTAVALAHGDEYVVAAGDGLDRVYLFEYEHCGGEGFFQFRHSLIGVHRFPELEDAKRIASMVGRPKILAYVCPDPAA